MRIRGHRRPHTSSTIGDSVTELLTIEETQKLADLEATIRDNRLYRAEFMTFEAYCQERWGISRPRAYELMTAATVVSAIADKELPAPTNERQARELGKVPDEQSGETTVVSLRGSEAGIYRSVGSPRASRAFRYHSGPTSTPPSLPRWVMTVWTSSGCSSSGFFGSRSGLASCSRLRRSFRTSSMPISSVRTGAAYSKAVG